MACSVAGFPSPDHVLHLTVPPLIFYVLGFLALVFLRWKAVLGLNTMSVLHEPGCPHGAWLEPGLLSFGHTPRAAVAASLRSGADEDRRECTAKPCSSNTTRSTDGER